MSSRASQRPNNVAYYWRNREMEIARVRVRQQGMVEMLRELRQVPCADCGGHFQPHQMDFDHRDPATKSFNVMTGRAMLMATSRLMAEVAKCDVVCVNCHRLRTKRAAVDRQRNPPLTPSEKRRMARWNNDAALLASLRDVPCADCGGRFPACAMDFDHRNTATKVAPVSRLVGRATHAQILAEAAKCDIVCGNCHRLRTYAKRTTVYERE